MPASGSASRAHYKPMVVRATVYRTDSCLAHIVDHEDPSWVPTVYNGGTRWRAGLTFNTHRSYGLGQALPGTKMARFGTDWLTNPWTQLRWARYYAKTRYGSTCAAWGAWLSKGWW